MIRKKLYIVSSFHFVEKSVEISEEDFATARDELELRLRLIEAIGSNIKQGSYFSDGFYDIVVEAFNGVLNSSRKSAVEKVTALSRMAEEDFAKGEYLSFDLYRTMSTLALLKAKESVLEVKVTEEEKDATDHLEVYERDKKIARRIIETGDEENILFLGSAHSPEAYTEAIRELKWHRVQIDTLPEEIAVYGFLPTRFRSSILQIDWSVPSGKKVKVEIDYVSS